MTTEGIEAVYVETHNWGRMAKFLESLGYEVEFATERGSGLLRNGTSPYVLLAEVAEDQRPEVQIVLHVAAAAAFSPDPSLDVVKRFEETHYGTQEMTVRDPDGRVWSLQAPLKS